MSNLKIQAIATVGGLPKPFFVTLNGVTKPACFDALEVNFGDCISSTGEFYFQANLLYIDKRGALISKKPIAIINAKIDIHDIITMDKILKLKEQVDSELSLMQKNRFTEKFIDKARKENGYNSHKLSPKFHDEKVSFNKKLKEFGESLRISSVNYKSDLIIKGFESDRHFDLDKIIEFMVLSCLKKIDVSLD